jgi:hypothetical protein
LKTLFADQRPNKGSFLITDSGDPVWPVQSEEELKALEMTAQLFDSEIQFITGKTGRSNPLNQLVISIGENLKEEGSLYAHLTKREFKQLNNVEDIYKSPLPHVLIIKYNDLNDRLLNYLYNSNHAYAPGLLISYYPNTIRTLLLTKSASLQLCGNSEPYRVDINAISAFTSYYKENYEVHGSKAEPAVIREILTKKKTLLNIITHSDGIDAYFGKLTLCPLFKIYDSNIDLPPNCLCTDICHRQKLSIDEAIEKNLLISTENISAQLLNWMTCRGLRINPSMINPLWGLAPQLIHNPSIGAMVSPWKIVFTHIQHAAQLAEEIEKGKSIGEAVATFHRSKAGLERGLTMCILGDPEIRFKKTIDRPNYSTIPKKELTYNETQEISFLRNFLKALIQKYNVEVRALAQAALCTLENYEWTVCQGLISKEGLLKELQKEIIDILITSGAEAIVLYVDLLNELSVVNDKIKCFSCHQFEAEEYLGKFMLPSIDQRKITICPNCGIIQERSSNSSPLQFSIKENKVIELNGELPKENWRGKLFLHYKLKDQSQSVDWPEDNMGLPERMLATSFHWPQGPVYVTLFMFEGTKLSILRHPFSAQ